jgi:hypothetical protein
MKCDATHTHTHTHTHFFSLFFSPFHGESHIHLITPLNSIYIECVKSQDWKCYDEEAGLEML